MENKIVIICIIAICLGLFIGFMAGSYVTIKSVAKVASGFIDPKLVEQAVFMFQNNIGTCFPSNFSIT